MKQLQKILVGHDLQTSGETAFQSAVALAQRSGAVLRLVHVVEPPQFYQRLSHPFTPPYTLEELTQKAGEKLAASAAEVAPLQVEYEVRTGKPFVELILARRAWQADLLVVGGTAKGDLLGNTSERVVRKALVPVLVAKKPLVAEAKTFLVPTDFSPCARKATEEAVSLAESFGSRLLFFHALAPPSAYASAYGIEMAVPPPVLALKPEDLEGEWQVFLSGLTLEKVAWEKRTSEGRAATTIVEQAKDSQVDLIVMGTHGRSGLAHMLLGSVAEEVVRVASCSVLTIRPEAFQFELP